MRIRKNQTIFLITGNVCSHRVLRTVMYVLFLFLFVTGCERAEVLFNKDTVPLNEAGIEKVSPANLEKSVAVNPIVTVNFMAGTYMTDLSGLDLSLKRGTEDVHGSMIFKEMTAAFKPDDDLISESEYTATLKTSRMEMSGEKREIKYSWKFNTGTNRQDYSHSILSVYPEDEADNVPVTSKLTITFSKDLTPFLESITSVTLKKGSIPVEGSLTFSGATATFTPAVSLNPGSEYNARVIFGEGDNYFYNNKSRNYSSWTFMTAQAALDITPPTIASVIPANNAATVPTSGIISVTFSEPMNTSTINSSTFTLKRGTTAVSGTVAASGATATFTPSGSLVAGVVYTATITTGVKDVAGNLLAASYSWNFTTSTQADVTPPTVLTVVPANGATSVALNSQITATFSEIMTSSTINSSTFTLTLGSTNITGTVSYSGTTATFVPSGTLTGSTVYTVTITTGVKDMAGNSLSAAKTWSFTTVAAAPAGMSFATDVVPVLTLCNNCHTHPWTVSSNPSTFYTNLVNAGYVNPTSYTSSKIYIKLSGGHPGSAISSTDVNKILTWMKEGSKNN